MLPCTLPNRGAKVLIVERGGYLPRERESGSLTTVFAELRNRTTEQLLDGRWHTAGGISRVRRSRESYSDRATVGLPGGLDLSTTVAAPDQALLAGWLRQSRERGSQLCPPFGDPKRLCGGHDYLYGEHRFAPVSVPRQEEHGADRRRLRRDLVDRIPFLRLSAGPMPPGGAGLS
jgi:hypothetical protein